MQPSIWARTDPGTLPYGTPSPEFLAGQLHKGAGWTLFFFPPPRGGGSGMGDPGDGPGQEPKTGKKSLNPAGLEG